MPRKNVPLLLYHKIFGGNSFNFEEEVDWALNQIKVEGLLPMIATAWANLIPEQIRDQPIIWLTENMRRDRNGYNQWLQIDMSKLDQSNIYKLDKADVEWWVYVDKIPYSAIQEANPIL